MVTPGGVLFRRFAGAVKSLMAATRKCGETWEWLLSKYEEGIQGVVDSRMAFCCRGVWLSYVSARIRDRQIIGFAFAPEEYSHYSY